MPTSSSTPRFFALTAERLEAISLHRLTLADVRVWAFIELQAKPRQPIPFALERVALSLGVGVNTVRRAVRRLIGAGLLVGRLEGNRHHLAPAEPAFFKAPKTPETLANLSSTPEPDTLPNRVEDAPQAEAVEGLEGEGSLPNRVGLEAATLPNRVEDNAPKAGGEPVPAVPPKKLKSRDKKVSFNACAHSEALSRDWGIYPAVAARLVGSYGPERVGEVVRWGEHLKAIGKLRSRGWVYQALVRGWGAPDTYHQAQHRAQEGLPEPQQSPTPVKAPERPVEAPLDAEGKVNTLARMLAQPFPASKRLAAKLAADWGIDLTALECQVLSGSEVAAG